MNAPLAITARQRNNSDLSHSDSLDDLAAGIKAEHEETTGALKSALDHAINAGELLIEAKSQLKHGQWLPWLRDHCAMPERTAQFYIHLARHRLELEGSNPQRIADLTLMDAQRMLAKPAIVKSEAPTKEQSTSYDVSSAPDRAVVAPVTADTICKTNLKVKIKASQEDAARWVEMSDAAVKALTRLQELQSKYQGDLIEARVVNIESALDIAKQATALGPSLAAESSTTATVIESPAEQPDNDIPDSLLRGPKGELVPERVCPQCGFPADNIRGPLTFDGRRGDRVHWAKMWAKTPGAETKLNYLAD
jgi:hypothetical protein